MEVQLPQQSVQINLNNKIITLHNVTIVKNPRIVKVDAAQYSNLLKGAAAGAPIKLVNGANNSLKLPLPSLVPMKSLQAPALIKTTPIFNQTSAPSVIVNQTPVIKQASNFVTNPIIRTFQPVQPSSVTTGAATAVNNGTIQIKPMIFAAQNSTSPVKIQTIPVKPTVIISPQKINDIIPKKIITTDKIVQQQQEQLQDLQPQQQQIQLQQQQPQVHQQQIQIHLQTAGHQSPPPLQSISSSTPATSKILSNQTSVITKPLQQQQQTQLQPQVASSHSLNDAPVLPIKTKVIVSPPLKNKSISNEDSLPEAKKPCTKLEFRCMFCKEIFYDDPQLLLNHMNIIHVDKIPASNEDLCKQNKFEEKETNGEKVEKVEKPVNEFKNIGEKSLTSPARSSSYSSSSSSSSMSSSSSEDEDEDMTQDDDESEVNDLIMDLEDTQENSDTERDDDEGEVDDASSQDRTNASTPESPEFEEHIPSQNESNVSAEEIGEQYDENDYDIDLLCLLLEPIVDLQYDEDEENSQEESEAMKLYREAMEINYQQNGIKKRGRRKSRMPKVSDAMNGILANFLDAPIKIPQGPGRGRRKEVNEQELEADRNNGICFFQCTQCDKSFKLVGDLARHTRSHTISSPYRCSICSKVFTHIGSLNTHLRIHSGERPYKCKFCDKSFTQSNSLMVHVKSHLSNKPFSCTQCNKGFLNASSLAFHQKTHTGPTSVTCPIDSCGKEFRDNIFLEEHMQTHKQSMLYQCSQCLEKFEQACQLVQHVKSHIGDKPFQCTICSRSFTQPGSLNTHLRIHTGERPFSCTQCPKRFTQASSLSVHMKIHGEKEFKCEICGKSYSQEAFLEKHKLKHKEGSPQVNGTTNGILQE